MYTRKTNAIARFPINHTGHVVKYCAVQYNINPTGLCVSRYMYVGKVIIPSRDPLDMVYIYARYPDPFSSMTVYTRYAHCTMYVHVCM